MNTKILSQFRTIALLEGISTLTLFFIAMPLKYLMNLPLAVKYTGWVHGILFLAYIAWLVLVSLDRKWSFSKICWSALASLVPFGTFVLDAKLLKPELRSAGMDI